MKKLKNNNDNSTTVIDSVNFDNFTLSKKKVSINNKELPLAIGDKIKLSDSDKISKTIVGIMIHEDGRVSYILEWYDQEHGQFHDETVTLTELKLLHANLAKNKKNKIGF